MESIQNRFKDLTPEEIKEIYEMWHTSRVPYYKRYDRLIWSSRELNKLHPENSTTFYYKFLDNNIN
jgi:hypothetical protein